MTDKKSGDTLEISYPDTCGNHLYRRTHKDGKTSYGVLSHYKEGKDLQGKSLVGLEHIEENRYRVTREVPIDRPAMVSSPSYREGWDRIFGGKTEVGQA